MKQMTNTNGFWSRMTMVAVLLTLGFGAAFAQGLWPDYDFKAANADGDTLYYRITSSTAPYTVAVTRCHDSASYASQLSLNDYDTLVVVPETVSFSGISYSVTAVDARTFSLQQGICTVQLPASITSIGVSAFAHSSLRNITIPTAVTFLGDSAFAFTLIETIEIPANISVLKTGSFVGCDSLKNFIMNEGLEEIEENIFSSNRIQTLIFPASLRQFRPLTSSTLGCRRIEFLTDSDHPDDVLSLSPSCFRGLSQHLQTVVFSDNIVHLPDNCFAGFHSLVGTVTLPSRLSVVPYRCFYNCTLYDVQFPPMLERIEDQAFMGIFINHPVFSIPATTNHIGSQAFFFGGFIIVTMEGEQPPTLGNNAFNTNRQIEITVPCGNLLQYLTAQGWSELATSPRVTIGEDEGCVGVEEYDLSEFKVYPNPADEVLYVEMSAKEIANVVLYDLQGRVVGANNYSPLQGNATINVRNLPAGIYLLRVMDTEGKSYNQKVVVK